MAKKQAITGLFTDVLKQGKELNEVLISVKNEIKDISKAEKNKILEIDENTLKGVKELEKSLTKLNQLKEASNKVNTAQKKIKEEEKKVNKELKLSTDEEVKTRLKHNMAVAEQRKQLKYLLDLENAEKNSINELRLKVKALTQERNNLNTETKEGQQRIKELNEEINQHNELIKENVDKQTQQKMTIGGYREEIEKAIGSLSQNNQVLGILANGYERLSGVLQSSKDTFENLKTEFNLVREAILSNTLATNANTLAVEENTIITETNAVATATNTLAVEENTLITETNTVATATNTSWLQRHYQALLLNTKAIWRMVFSARALKLALQATGIGLLVVALTGLVGMFSQGISGSLRFEKTMKALGAGLRNIFSGITSIMSGVILKLGSISESISLSIDQAVLSVQKLTLSSEEYYSRLAELNDRQEKLDIAQAEANIKIREGIEQTGKTVEVAVKASEGAIISLQRRLDSLNLSVSISKLQRDFNTLSNLAEDDTVSFTTRMKLYEQAETKRAKLTSESMKKTVLDYQSGLAKIVQTFQESEKTLTTEQTALFESAKRLSKVNILGMDEAGIKGITKQIENLTFRFTDYLSTAKESTLTDDFYSIDEKQVEELVSLYNEVIAKDQEVREILISSNERRRKAIQDEYEIEFDVRETFVNRLKDLYAQQANDERNTYDLRLKALDQFRYGAEIALQQQIDSFNEFSKEMEKSQKIELGLLGVETSVKGVQIQMQKVNDEFKLFVNGVELNQDVFQGNFLKGLTGENAEKNLTFLRYIADLMTDVNSANLELKNSNYELAKSYLEVNDAINTSNKLLELKKQELAQTKALNEANNLAFMNEFEFAKYKQQQKDLEIKQSIKQAETELQISRNKSGLKAKELEMEKEIFEEKKRIDIEKTKLAIIQEQDPQQIILLQEKLNALQGQRFENTQKYKDAQNDLLNAQKDVVEKEVNLEASKNESILNERDKHLAELKKRADMLNDIASGIDKIDDFYHERKMKRLDRELQRSKDHENRLLEAKKMGSEQATESIAIEIARQEKLQLKKEKLERRKQRTELVISGLKAYASNLEKGVTNPLQKTFTDTVALAQFLRDIPLFWEGAENVGKSLGKPHLNDARDNYLVRVDGTERIMTKSQNEKLGDITNDELANVGSLWNAGLLKDITKLNFSMDSDKIKVIKASESNSDKYLLDIKNELSELPNRMPISRFEYDEVNKMVVDIVKKGNTTSRTRSRIR